MNYTSRDFQRSITGNESLSFVNDIGSNEVKPENDLLFGESFGNDSSTNINSFLDYHYNAYIPPEQPFLGYGTVHNQNQVRYYSG